MGRLRLGVRGRQIVAMTAVAAFVALVTSGLSAALLVRSSLGHISDGAELIGRTLYHQMAVVIREHWPDRFERALAADPGLRRLADAAVGYSPVTVYVAIIDDGGRVVFHSDPVLQGRPAPREASLTAFAERNPLAQLWALATDSGLLALDLPVNVAGDRPFGSIRVAVSTVLVRQELSSLIVRNAALSAVVVLVAFGVSFVLADRMLAPVERLRRELARIDVGEEPPLDLRTVDDASRIATLFSSMARELERRQEQAGEHEAVDLDVDEGLTVLSRDGRILLSNESAARMLGAAGRPDGPLAADHPLRRLADEAQRAAGPVGPTALSLSAVAGGGDCVARAWSLRADGTPVDGRDPAGGTGTVIVTLRDAERQSRLASELAHSRKLGAVGRISSGVSHEMKNVLNAIVMHADLLRRKVGEDSAGSAFVDVLEKELGRLDRIVQTFLQFTRPETIRFERLDVRAVIHEALELVAGRVASGGIRVERDLPSSPLVVNGDAEMLRQALVNLLLNACDAMPEGGTLRVAVRRDPASGAPVVSVEDTGVGISADRLPRVFDLFHSSKPGGSGIGLSLVYRIVHLHGGRIDVASEPGAGTRFTMELRG